MNTLREHQHLRLLLTAHCENPACLHWAEVPRERLVARFGWDFNVVERRSYFIAHLICSKCGRRSPEIICSLDDRRTAGVAHSVEPGMTIEEATQRHLEFSQRARERNRGAKG